jgi:hypothetical protein
MKAANAAIDCHGLVHRSPAGASTFLISFGGGFALLADAADRQSRVLVYLIPSSWTPVRLGRLVGAAPDSALSVALGTQLR